MLGSRVWRHGEERSGKIRCPGHIRLEKLKGDDKGPRSQSGRWRESWHQTGNNEIMVRTSPNQRGGSPCLHQALLSWETLCHRLFWQPKAHKVGNAAPTDALSHPDAPTASSWHGARSRRPAALLPSSPEPATATAGAGGRHRSRRSRSISAPGALQAGDPWPGKGVKERGYQTIRLS